MSVQPTEPHVPWLDRWQRKHPVVSVPIAVIYKFFDDQGNYLAAIITYYAFIAIFPLMLLGTSILGFVLQGNPELQERLLESALRQFPIIGDQLGKPGGLRGSTVGIVVGSLAALYGAMGLGQAIQNALNVAWSVPRNSRPNPVVMRIKSLGLLMVVGLGLLVVSVVAEVVAASGVLESATVSWVDWALRGVNMLVMGIALTLLFRLAAARGHHLLRAAPGGFAVAFMWQLLQLGGSYYVSQVIATASSMNKIFALVLGLVGLLYVGSVMAMLGISINVVLARGLYPRALLTPFTDNVVLTEGDRRAYAGMAEAQRLKGFQTVLVEFGPGPKELSARARLTAEAIEAEAVRHEELRDESEPETS